MILRRKKIQKLQTGGSVGFYPQFQVDIPKTQVFDPSVMFQRYGSSSGRGGYGKAAKPPKAPAAKSLGGYKFEGTTKGGHETLSKIVDGAIKQAGSLVTTDPTYTQQFDAVQKGVKDMNARFVTDGAEFKAASSAVASNNSGDVMTLQRGSIFVQDKETQDIVQMPLLEYYKKENREKYSNPLTNNQLMRLKDLASDKRFSSLLLDQGIQTNSILQHNLGLSNLTAEFDKVLKRAGNITSKDNNLVIGGTPIAAEALRGILATGEVPKTGASTNETQLYQAMKQLSNILSQDSKLDDSLTSAAISNIRNRGLEIDTSTEEGIKSFNVEVQKEKNKLIADIMRTHLNIKIAGAEEDDTTGGDSLIKGSGTIGSQAAIGMAGDVKEVDLGTLVKKGDAKVDFSGVIARGINLNMAPELLEEQKKNEDKPVTLDKSTEIAKWTETDVIYTPDGKNLGNDAASYLVLDVRKPVTRVNVPAVNGKIDFKANEAINKVMQNPKIVAEWKEVMKTAMANKKDALSADETKRLFDWFKNKALARELGGSINIQPMLLMYVHSTDEAPFFEDLAASSFYNPEDPDSEAIVDAADIGTLKEGVTGFWVEQNYGTWVLTPALSLSSMQAKQKGAVAAKTQLTPEALEEARGIETRELSNIHGLTPETINLYLNK